MDCHYCKRNTEVDWKNVDELRRYITSLGKIRRRDRTGLCSRHQRNISKAIKRARHFGTLSPVSKY